MHFWESMERRDIVIYVYATVQYPWVSEDLFTLLPRKNQCSTPARCNVISSFFSPPSCRQAARRGRIHSIRSRVPNQVLGKVATKLVANSPCPCRRSAAETERKQLRSRRILCTASAPEVTRRRHSQRAGSRASKQAAVQNAGITMTGVHLPYPRHSHHHNPRTLPPEDLWVVAAVRLQPPARSQEPSLHRTRRT